MAADRLLHIMTPFATFEIHGPTQPRWASIMIDSNPNCQLVVESSAGLATTSTSGIDGQALRPDASNWPRFYEQTDYQIRVKSHMQGRMPILRQRDPLLFNKVAAYPDDMMCAGAVNFGQQVGLCTFEVSVGHETLRLTVEVFPAKIDYASDYQALLADVSASARALALEYLRATYRTVDTRDVPTPTALDWVSLLRNEIDTLDRSVRYVNSQPYRVLKRDAAYVQIERIKHVDTRVIKAITQGRGRGGWGDYGNAGRIRSILPATRKQETLDTPEHRWLKVQLKVIRDRLSDIHHSLSTTLGTLLITGRGERLRSQAEVDEIARLIRTLTELLALPLFDGINEPPPPGFTSLTLLGGAGYGEAHRVIMVLRLGLGVQETSTGAAVSTMDLHELYETWCFIEIVRLVLGMTGANTDLSTLLQVEEQGIRIRLARGRRASVTCTTPSFTVEIAYNENYPGLTGNQRPDIVLRFRHLGWPNLIVLLDAKYRLDTTAEYQRQFGCPGPPIEAINELHRYRDAIVVEEDPGLMRPVVKGAALYPLGATNSITFPQSRLRQALDVLGIGALPFLPNNRQYVEQWIRNLLALPPEDLAEAGPPFNGVHEKAQRSSGLGSM